MTENLRAVEDFIGKTYWIWGISQPILGVRRVTALGTDLQEGSVRH